MMNRTTIYMIHVKGHLDTSWSSWFDDMKITSAGGETGDAGGGGDVH